MSRRLPGQRAIQGWLSYRQCSQRWACRRKPVRARYDSAWVGQQRSRILIQSRSNSLALSTIDVTMRTTLLIALATLSLSACDQTTTPGITREDTPELTQEYAEFRATQLEHVRYQLTVELDPSLDYFSGKNRISFDLRDRASDLTIDFSGGEVFRVSVNTRILSLTTRTRRFRYSINRTSRGDSHCRSRRLMTGISYRPARRRRSSRQQTALETGCSRKRCRYRHTSCLCMPVNTLSGRTAPFAFHYGSSHASRWPTWSGRIRTCGSSTPAPVSISLKSISASTIRTGSTTS